MLWSIITCQNEVFGDQYPAYFRLTCKRGKVVGKLVNANPGLKFNQKEYSKSKTEGQTINRKPRFKQSDPGASLLALAKFTPTRSIKGALPSLIEKYNLPPKDQNENIENRKIDEQQSSH